MRSSIRLLVLLASLGLLTGPDASAQNKKDQPAVVVVLGDKFQDLKGFFPKESRFPSLSNAEAKWVLAKDFQEDKEFAGYIIRLSYAKPVAIQKSRKFAQGNKVWNDVQVRYPVEVTYRAEGKQASKQLLKGTIVGEASPLEFKLGAVAATDSYTLRLMSVDDLSKEAIQNLFSDRDLTGSGGQIHRFDAQVETGLASMIAAVDANGQLRKEVRFGKKDATVIVQLKNRLPFRVSGEVNCSGAEKLAFDLKPGDAKTCKLTVENLKGNTTPVVYFGKLRLQPQVEAP